MWIRVTPDQWAAWLHVDQSDLGPEEWLDSRASSFITSPIALRTDVTEGRIFMYYMLENFPKLWGTARL